MPPESGDLDHTRAESRGLAARIVEAFVGDDRPPPGAAGAALLAHQRASLARLERPHPDASVTTLGGVACRVFTPDGPARAVALHFHGGGMVMGSATMHDHDNAALAARHGVAVVSVGYRLAPEHPWPAALDDGEAVARTLVADARAMFGTGRLVVAGESAGAALALGTLLRLRDDLGAIDRCAGALLTFGIYDWSVTPADRARRDDSGDDTLDPESLARFADCYLPDPDLVDRGDPGVSPLYADLRGLPHALMTVGTADHLYLDTVRLAERWTQAGNSLDLLVAPDAPHGFTAIDCGATAEYRRRLDRFWRQVAPEPPPPPGG